MEQQGFYGYERKFGRPGIRNYVCVFSAVTCANQIAKDIVSQIPETVYFTHSNGCGQVAADIKIVERTLANLVLNPNVGAALIVGIGCEGVQTEEIKKIVQKSGKPFEHLILMEESGYKNILAQGVEKARSLVDKIKDQERVWQPISRLLMGIKCGASDTTSGLISNPLIGRLADLLVDQNAGVVFGEVTEFIGAEDQLFQRCANAKTREKLEGFVFEIEERIKATGEDIRGGQPSAGNIRGGITTLEEKSLGAVIKSGQREIVCALEYGEIPDRNGLMVMNTPGREPEALTGLAAGGAQVIVFSTGLGAPQGFPFVPIVKITGNPNTAKKLVDHIDFHASDDFTNSKEAYSREGKNLFDKLVSILNGEKTKSELLNFTEPTDIWVKGPVI